MEEIRKLFRTIRELESELKMLRLCGGINKEVYEELTSKLHSLDKGLNEFAFEITPDGSKGRIQVIK